MLSVSGLFDRLSHRMDLRRIFLLVYGRSAEKQRNSIWSLASNLRNRCTCDLCDETTEKESGRIVSFVSWNLRCGRICDRICRDTLHGIAVMGLQRVIPEPSRNHLFPKRCNIRNSRTSVSLSGGACGRKDVSQNEFPECSLHLSFDCSFISGGLRAELSVPDADYILRFYDDLKIIIRYDRFLYPTLWECDTILHRRIKKMVLERGGTYDKRRRRLSDLWKTAGLF